MNCIIEKNQAIVKGFYRATLAIDNKKAENKSRYSPAIATEENNKLNAEKENLYNKARDGIIANFNEVRELCSIASFPAVENITDDSILFTDKSPIELTTEEIRAYRDKYSNNFTMLRIIKDWLEKAHTGFNDYTDIKMTIHLPIEQLREYAENASTALGLLSTINQNAKSVSSAIIDSFCGELNKNTMDIIGDGEALQSAKRYNIPEKAKHLMDFIVLRENNQSFGFNFNRIR